MSIASLVDIPDRGGSKILSLTLKQIFSDPTASRKLVLSTASTATVQTVKVPVGDATVSVKITPLRREGKKLVRSK